MLLGCPISVDLSHLVMSFGSMGLLSWGHYLILHLIAALGHAVPAVMSCISHYSSLSPIQRNGWFIIIEWYRFAVISVHLLSFLHLCFSVSGSVYSPFLDLHVTDDIFSLSYQMKNMFAPLMFLISMLNTNCLFFVEFDHCLSVLFKSILPEVNEELPWSLPKQGS